MKFKGFNNFSGLYYYLKNNLGFDHDKINEILHDIADIENVEADEECEYGGYPHNDKSGCDYILTKCEQCEQLFCSNHKVVNCKGCNRLLCSCCIDSGCECFD